MKREPVVIGGQKIGKFKASWLLTKESFRFLRADPEMMWLPLITGLLNLILFVALCAIMYFVVLQGNVELFMAEEEGETLSPLEYVFIFCFYVIGAFTLALSQAGIAHIVYTRVKGGDATLMQGLRSAFSHWFSLLMWSLITATVGVILRFIAERSRLLGRIIIGLIGLTWGVLTYFVVPAVAIDNVSAFSAIKKSGSVLKKTWGETLITNISIGLVFMLFFFILIFALLGVIIFAVVVELPAVAIAGGIILVFGIFFLSLVQSALQGVIKTLLYVYALEHIVPENFNKELLGAILSRKGGGDQSDAAPVPPIPPAPPMQTTVPPQQ